MFRVILDSDYVKKWVLSHTPYPQRKGFDEVEVPMRGIGYEVEGKLVAGFTFMNHLTWYKSIEVGIALETKSPVLRGILEHVMYYPFVQLGCERVTAYVPKRAKPVRKLVQTIGFEEEGNLRHGFGTDDCMIYGLLKKEAQAKWDFTRSQA